MAQSARRVTAPWLANRVEAARREYREGEVQQEDVPRGGPQAAEDGQRVDPPVQRRHVAESQEEGQGADDDHEADQRARAAEDRAAIAARVKVGKPT